MASNEMEYSTKKFIDNVHKIHLYDQNDSKIFSKAWNDMKINSWPLSGIYDAEMTTPPLQVLIHKLVPMVFCPNFSSSFLVPKNSAQA